MHHGGDDEQASEGAKTSADTRQKNSGLLERCKPSRIHNGAYLIANVRRPCLSF